MKNCIKKSAAVLMCALLMLASLLIAPPGTRYLEARAAGGVAQSLESMINQYKDTFWTTTGGASDSSGSTSRRYAGAIQCKGFATMVFTTLFGMGEVSVGTGSVSSNSTNYRLNNVHSSVQELGVLLRFDEASLAALLAQARPGDFIQVRRTGGTPHSMIFVSSGGDSVKVFECNNKGTCNVAVNTYSYNTFCQKNAGVSLYTFKNYPASSYGVDARYAVPFQVYPISSGRIAVYSRVQGSVESGRYIDGATDKCTITAVYDNGWADVTYPTASGSRSSHVPISEFVAGTSLEFSHANAQTKIYTYRRSDLGESFGYVDVGDRIDILCSVNGATQIMYPVSGGYKLGWVRGSDLATTPVPAPDPAPAPTGGFLFPLYAYTVSNARVSVYASRGGSPEERRYIDGAADKCTITAVYDNAWVDVTYPTSSGQRASHTLLSEFAPDLSLGFESFTAAARITTYTKPALSTSFGYIDAGDTVWKLGRSGGAVQVMYPLSAGGYKLGWIYESELPPPPAPPTQPTEPPYVPPAPGEVTGLAAHKQSFVNGDLAVFTWNAAANADSYECRLSRDGRVVKKHKTGECLWMTRLNGAGGYSFSVVAHGNGGSNAHGELLSFRAQEDVVLATVYSNGHTYMLFDGSCSRTEAQARCADMGGGLMTVTSAVEQGVLEQLLRSGGQEKYWLGGERSGDGFVWMTDEPFVYTNWEGGEPNNTGGIEDSIVAYRKNGRWNDDSNDKNTRENIGFICERNDGLSIALSAVSARMTAGQSSQLTASIAPADYSGDIVWLSSDYAVADVTQDGRVTAVGAGKAVISVLIDNGLTAAYCTVTVGEENEPDDEQPPQPPTAGATVGVQSVSAKPGSFVSVPVVLSGNPGIVGARMNIAYDPSLLTLTNIRDGGLLGTDALVVGDDLSRTPFTVLWEDGLATADHTRDGTLLTLEFYVNETATEQTTHIELLFDQSDFFNVGLGDVPFTATRGGVNIAAVSGRGDVNGDGVVNLMDVTVLKRYLANWSSATIAEHNSDADSNGRVELKDATYLRRYLAGGWQLTL